MIELDASEHPIKGVTVFRKSSKAEVVRTFDLDLKAGQNNVLIKSLPSTIDTESVRISGLGPVRLADVVCTNKPTAPLQFAGKRSEAIADLVRKKAALEGQKNIHEYEAHLLASYGKSITGEHVSPKDFESFLKSFVDNGKKSIETSHALDSKIVEIEKEIEERTRKENEDTKQGSQNGQVSVTLSSGVDVKVKIKMTYMVSRASWEPTYELHASTDSTGKPSSSLALYYRARIRQSTGEDWANTQVTLSTVSVDSLFKSIPKLVPMKVRPGPHRGGFTGFDTNKPFVPPQTLPIQMPIQMHIRKGDGQSNVARPMQGGNTFGTTNVFGGSAFGSSSQPAQPNFGFGQQQQQPQQTNLFGTSTQSNVGLFGQQQPVQTNLFGNPAQSDTSIFTQQQYATELGQASTAPGEDTDASIPVVEDGFEEIALPTTTNEVSSTLISETPLAVSFTVEGQSTIPSDGLPHQAEIAKLDFEGEIEYIVVPRIDATVYLQCQVKNTSEYRLLPGPVTVLLDDSYVSKTTISDINTNDTFTCTFGADAATKVTYTRKAKTVKTSGGAFSEEQKTTTVTAQITIQNKHQFALTRLIVRDLIPTSADERVKVILRKPDGLANLKQGGELALASIAPGLKVRWNKQHDGNGGEKEGMFEWLWTVAAGGNILLESEWDIRFPADLNLFEGVAPVIRK